MSNGLQVLNDGTPVVVKLQNGDEIIGVLLLDELDGMLIDRPLQAIREAIAESDTFVRYGLRFEKWIKYAGTNCVPLVDGNVLSIALVSDKMSEVYSKWAEQHYEPLMPEAAEPVPGEEVTEPSIFPPATDASGALLNEEEVAMRDRMFQVILENFESDTVH